MNKVIVFGLGTLGLLGLLALADNVETSAPAKPRQYTNEPLALPPGWSQSQYQELLKRVAGGTPSLGAIYQPNATDAAALSTIYHYQRDVWQGRAAAFVTLYGTGKDATSYLRAGPWFNIMVPGGGSSVSGWGLQQVNRYGQGPQGYGGGIDVLTIIATASNYTLPNIPGVGSAANAVIQGAVALGKGESLENAAIAAARGALPPWGQVAFDMAVGLYSGNTDLDEAAIDAGLAYLETKYPGARAAYDEGKKVANQAGL